MGREAAGEVAYCSARDRFRRLRISAIAPRLALWNVRRARVCRGEGDLLFALRHAILDESLQIVAVLALRLALLAALQASGDLWPLRADAIIDRRFEFVAFQAFCSRVGSAARNELFGRGF